MGTMNATPSNEWPHVYAASYGLNGEYHTISQLAFTRGWLKEDSELLALAFTTACACVVKAEPQSTNRQ